MYTIKFNSIEITEQMSEFSDAEIEAARGRIEHRLGQSLSLDPRTGFPNFDVTDARGEPVGGG